MYVLHCRLRSTPPHTHPKQLRIQSASTAMSMYIEFSAIITCRVLYIVFRQHRVVVNFGYGFDANAEAMTSAAMLITAMFIELAFEAVVDGFALILEFKHGIDLDKFWEMWRVNAAAFWGQHVFDGLLATTVVIWAFKLVPTAIWCTSPTDPCSCTGGGFEIYESFCVPASTTKVGNETVNTTTASVEQARQEFQGIFSSLAGDDITTVVISISVVFAVATVLALAFFYQERAEAAARAKELTELKEERGASFVCRERACAVDNSTVSKAFWSTLMKQLQTITNSQREEPRQAGERVPRQEAQGEDQGARRGAQVSRAQV